MTIICTVVRILGVYSENTRDECLGALEQLAPYGLDFETRESAFFTRLNEACLMFLEDYTHFVVSFTQKEQESCWLSLIAGYALGSMKPLFLCGRDLSANISGLFPSGDIRVFFAREKEKYLLEERIRRAREELARSGISFTSEAFCESVIEGELKAVELFLAAGFSPDVQNKKKVPAICLAIRGQHRSIAMLLLENGVNIEVVSEDRGNTPVMEAAANGDDESVRMLVDAGADLNKTSKNGQTALILATGQPNENTALLLLDAGADPAISDNLGMSARKYAELFGKKEILRRINEKR